MSSLALPAAALPSLFPFGFLLARVAPDPPAPEQKRLAELVGTWGFKFEMKPGLFGSGGPVTGVDHNELLPGGFFLVRRSQTRVRWRRSEGSRSSAGMRRPGRTSRTASTMSA